MSLPDFPPLLGALARENPELARPVRRLHESGDELLLQEVASLAAQPLASGLGRVALLVHLFGEIEDPGSIRQGSRETCTAAIAQMMVARLSPREYVRLVAGLASPEGVAALASGDRIRRVPGSEEVDDSGRTSVSRLVQAALMDFANGRDAYDHATDTSSRPHGPAYRGLYYPQADRLLEAAMARRYDTWEVADLNRDEAMERIAEAVGREMPVPVAIQLEGSRHAVVVHAVDPHFVHVLNPWGRRTQFERRLFPQRLLRLSLPVFGPRSPVPEWARPPERKIVGVPTLHPAFPRECPGCGRRALNSVAIGAGPAGSLLIPACNICSSAPSSPARFLPWIAGAATILMIVLIATSSSPRMIASATALLGLAVPVWIAAALSRSSPVRLVSAREEPPLLEFTAPSASWLSEFARLNPGSMKNFLERW